MADDKHTPGSTPLSVHVKDCILATLVMVLVDAIAGTHALVLLVFGFSVSVVILLLLREAYLGLDLDDDDGHY